jgi:hypothetical protein
MYVSTIHFCLENIPKFDLSLKAGTKSKLHSLIPTLIPSLKFNESKISLCVLLLTIYLPTKLKSVPDIIVFESKLSQSVLKIFLLKKGFNLSTISFFLIINVSLIGILRTQNTPKKSSFLSKLLGS